MKKYLSLIFSSTLAAQLPAVIISGTNIALSDITPDTGLDADFALTIYEDAGAEDPTSLFFDYDGTTFSPVDMNLDGGSDWYLTSINDLFSASNILAGSFPLSAKSDTMGLQFIDQIVGSDFYLGVSTDGAGTRTNFGWVHL